MGVVSRRPISLLAIVSLALVVKATVLLQLHDHLLLQPSGVLDDAVYVSLGQRVAAGDWALGPDVYYLSPFYTYFLGIVLKLSSGSLMGVRIVQVALGVSSVGLIYATARRWFDDRTALVAATFAVLTGLFSFYEILLLQTSVDPFLTALALYTLTVALQEGSPAWGGAAGCALGLLAMNRPNALAFLPVAAVGLGFVHRRSRATIVPAAALLLAAALTLAPIALRNRFVAGDWVLISSHGGLNFYIGNNEHADGTYSPVPGVTPSIQGQVKDARTIAERALGRSLKASEVSDYFYARAREWIAGHPADAGMLLARKIAYMFNTADLALNYSYTYYSRDESTLLTALPVGPWLLVPLGFFGLVAAPPARASRVAFAVWASFVPVYALAVALFFVSSRYRLPLLVPLCVMGGAGTMWLAAAIRARRAQAAGAALLLLIPLAVLANWNIGPDTGRANERTEMVAHLIAAGRSAEAEGLIARTAPEHPAPGFLYFRAGYGYLERGDTTRAVAYLEHAMRAEPAQPDIRFFLGEALVAAGRYEEAVPQLAAARDAGFTPELAGYKLATALAQLGRTQDARDALRRAVASAEAGTEVDWLKFGELAMQLHDPAYAQPLLERAVAQRPASSPAHESLGLALLLQGLTDRAIPALSRAAALDSSSASARYNLAVALAQAGKIAEARAQAEAALRIRPDYPQAQEMLQRLPR